MSGDLVLLTCTEFGLSKNDDFLVVLSAVVELGATTCMFENKWFL